jgi:hypothetical protein
MAVAVLSEQTESLRFRAAHREKGTGEPLCRWAFFSRSLIQGYTVQSRRMEVAMAQTRRAQITIEPEEYRQLESLAHQKGISVADLILEAVRERYLTPPSSRREIVQEIFRLEIPIEEDWNSIEEEIARAHANGFP